MSGPTWPKVKGRRQDRTRAAVALSRVNASTGMEACQMCFRWGTILESPVGACSAAGGLCCWRCAERAPVALVAFSLGILILGCVS